MEQYSHILLAVELNAEADEYPIKKAKALAEQYGAKLSLIHSIEHLSSYGAAYGVAAGADIEEMLLDSATKELGVLAKELGVSEQNIIIKFGPAKIVILDEAKRLGCNLIIVGSHGRHGIRLLLGSTANAVLHGADCDVLAVRLKS